MTDETTAGAAYTYEDYMNTDAPYAEIYELSRSPFEQARTLELATAEAKTVGVGNFKTLYKKYCEERESQKKKALAQNATNFEDQPLELNTGSWYADELGGVYRAGMGGAVETACPHPIEPTERITNIDTGIEKMKIAFRKIGEHWRSIVVEKNVLADPRAIVKLANSGVMVTSRTAPTLCDYFMEIETMNYELIPNRRSVSRMGWIDGEGFSPYVPGLLFDGEAAFAPLWNAIKPHGKPERWIAAATRLRREESIAARIVLAASFASALVSPLGCLPFFVHLWGVDSSTGKTVALMVAASVWASPEMGKYVRTFNGTDVGYERLAGFLNSMPMCIDELQLAKDRRGNVVFNVYTLAQGAGRSRGTRTGGIDVTPTWTNAIITTGETPLTSLSSGAGAVNRVIEIECTSAERVIDDGHLTLEGFRDSYGHAGRLFVERLQDAGQMDVARNVYEEAFLYLNHDETTDKQAMAAALIVTADWLATEWIFHDDMALTTGDLRGFLASRSAVSTGARAYDYLCDWVMQNRNKLMGADETEFYGVLETSENMAYILPSVLKKALEDEGYNAQATISYLKSSGLVTCDGGRTTKQKWIKGGNMRFVWLRLPDGCENEGNKPNRS